MASSRPARGESRARTNTRCALFFGGMLLVPGALACSTILGLSDFEKGPCPGGPCATDAGPGVDSATDAEPDAPPIPKGADPVSWARWPMPNYFAGDAGGRDSSAPLVAVDGGVVVDTVTSLVWRSELVSGDFAARDVLATCQALPNGPWRAPKRIELVSLLDYSRPELVDRAKFPNLLNFRVWTMSEVRPFRLGDPNQAYWTVSFESGTVEPLGGASVAKVLCVRAKG